MVQDSFEIIPFSPALQPYFESINKAWVTQYFSLEPFDLAQLENQNKPFWQREEKSFLPR